MVGAGVGPEFARDRVDDPVSFDFPGEIDRILFLRETAKNTTDPTGCAETDVSLVEVSLFQSLKVVPIDQDVAWAVTRW